MKASIDIGTNTVLLLVAEVEDDTISVIHEKQRIPRLGKGLDYSGELADESINRVIMALKEYQALINRNYPSVDSIRVSATSAVRDAQNRGYFLEVVAQKTGLKVQVLSGYEEAQYTFRGATGVLNGQKEATKVIIDIGGGSTEVATGRQKVNDRYSYDMGCVRFTERFLQDNPPTESQISECRAEIRRMLNDYQFNFEDNAVLIGVAGTVTSLAYIEKGLKAYNADALTGHKIDGETIGEYICLFKEWPTQKLIDKYPVVMKGRADIFLAGLLILQEFMQKYGFRELITSTGGIRHGLILGNK